LLIKNTLIQTAFSAILPTCIVFQLYWHWHPKTYRYRS